MIIDTINNFVFFLTAPKTIPLNAAIVRIIPKAIVSLLIYDSSSPKISFLNIPVQLT